MNSKKIAYGPYGYVRDRIWQLSPDNNTPPIVHTNGCFDLLHYGHISLLNKIKELFPTHKLVVGVNSDKSLNELKNHTPFNPQRIRIEQVASLECVDLVYLLEDLTPIDAIDKIMPKVHVKGGDYQRENLPEKDIVEFNGGTIIILPLIPFEHIEAKIKIFK